MRLRLDDVIHLDECCQEVFDVIEEELHDLKEQGHSVKRWSEHYMPSGQRGPYKRSTDIHHLLFYRDKGSGLDFRIKRHQRMRRSLSQEIETSDRTIKCDFTVHRSSRTAATLAKFLPYLGAIVGGFLGWAALALFGDPQTANVWVWVIVPLLVLAFVGARIKRNFSAFYSRLVSANSSSLSEEAVRGIRARVEPLVEQVVDKWREKDEVYFQDKLEESAYDAIDLEDPENLALISYVQMTEGQDVAWRRYGLYLAERRKHYEAMLRKLRDEPEFHAIYKRAYERMQAQSGGK
ncbi:hypothetical protein GF402_03600 [Candidatus Fermentibacteria bacterium]|nr:hypothetical protein [Candidatus Fermentibacteria bacterium]